MGPIIKQSREQRFIETLGQMASECMGIKLSGGLVSQSLGYSEELEKVFFFIQIKTDNESIELMIPDPVFDPDSKDDDFNVSMVCSSFQTDDRDRVLGLMRKAELIDGQQLRSI